MVARNRRFGTAAVVAFALAVSLAGCSTLPAQEVTTSSGVACLNLRSTVTNIEGLRAWCRDHGDPAGARAWMSGIEGSLKSSASGDTEVASRVRGALALLDAQSAALSGSNSTAAMAGLPDALAAVTAALRPARDSICS